MGAEIPMTNLYVYPKMGEAFTFPLRKDRVTIGRAGDNDISLLDQFCSGHHAVVSRAEKGYVVEDRSSKNGTFVNGKRIRLETELKKGDEVLVGSTRILFDKEIQSQVEMVEGTDLSQSPNTVIGVRDILKKPALDRATRIEAPVSDLGRLQREQKFLGVLNEVSQALIYHLPLNKLLEYIMDLIAKSIPMDRGVLMIKEGNPPQPIPKVVRILHAGLRHQSIQVSQSIVQTALSQNQAILISDIQSDTQFRRQASLIQSEVRSAMCVPLWNNQEIIGLIYLDRTSVLEQFTQEDLKLLTLLANLAAVKIENAKSFEQALEKNRMERELALAAEIQKNFFPKENPVLKNYEVCGSNRSCYQVGGDYYDFIPIDASRLGIVIADVSGKGVSASLLMASLRARLQADIHPGFGLAETVGRLNDFVYRSSESHTFITFFFLELDTGAGRGLFVNAGHNPPLLLRKEGGTERLEGTGFCLGMFPSADYAVKPFSLGSGDILCLYTDGITESRNTAKDQYGDDRLIGLLRKHSPLPARAIMDRVFDEVRAFSSCAEPQDDMTLVLVKRIG